MVERKLTSRSPEATEELAARIGRALWPGAIVCLEGELGAGKTLFVRGLARGLEVEEGVSSPTYTLMHSYTGRLPLYHFDAWMEGRQKALFADGGADWLQADGVAVIEWAGRVDEWLPGDRLEIRLGHVDPETRSVLLAVPADGSPDYARLVTALELPEGVSEGA